MFLVGVALFLNPIYLSKSAKKYRQLLSGASILFFLPSTALARWVKKQVPYLEIEEESEQEAFCRELATKRLKAEAYADWEVQSAIASLGMQYNSSPMKEINPQISREIAETEPHKILESAPQTRRSDSTNIHPLESSDISPIAGAGLVTLIGTQGSGKSTLASTLIRYRIRQGHTVAVFDHHYAYGAYAPLKVYGKGKTHHQQFSYIE
jgi:ABC-type glutathione transport system ATPase component